MSVVGEGFEDGCCSIGGAFGEGVMERAMEVLKRCSLAVEEGSRRAFIGRGW